MYGINKRNDKIAKTSIKVAPIIKNVFKEGILYE